MDSTVGTFNCEYRAVGDATAPGPLELELDLRSHFARALDDGIGLTLGRDPTVYAIRRVDCEVTLRGDGRDVPELARRMAGAVTNAVVRALRDRNDRPIPGAAGSTCAASVTSPTATARRDTGGSGRSRSASRRSASASRATRRRS